MPSARKRTQTATECTAFSQVPAEGAPSFCRKYDTVLKTQGMYGRASYGASFIRLRFVETRYPRRLKPQKDEDDEDSADETTEEKVKAYGVAWMLKSTVAPSSFASFACRACRIHAGPHSDSDILCVGLRAPGMKDCL